MAHYVSILVNSKSTTRLLGGQQNRNVIHVVAGTGWKQEFRLTALDPTVEGKRAGGRGKTLAAVTIDGWEFDKRAAEASEDLGAIIKQINGIADRISSEVSEGEGEASRKLRAVALRLQSVAMGYAGPAAADEAIAPQRVPIRESRRLERNGNDCKPVPYLGYSERLK